MLVSRQLFSHWLATVFSRATRSIAYIVVILTFLLSTACTRTPTDPNEIIIGEFVSKLGAEAQFGKSVENGVHLAADEANSQGGIQKAKIRVMSVETSGDKTKIEKTIRAFADNPKVLAVIGEVSSEKSNWAAKVAQAEKLPMISPASTNPNVTENGSYIFRACYIDPFQGSAMATFAAQDLKIKKVVILRHDKSNYSLGLSEYFSEKFIKLGGSILSEETYSTAQGLPDLKDQIASIKEQKPQALFMPVYYSEASYLAKKIRAAGINAVLLGGDGWDSPFLFDLDKKSVDGVYFSNHFSADKKDESVQKFVEQYKKKYGDLPDGTAAMGYDAARIALAAIARATTIHKNPTRDEVRAEIAATKNFEGVSGIITIDENRNAKKSIVVLKTENGKFRYVKTIQPD